MRQAWTTDANGELIYVTEVRDPDERCNFKDSFWISFADQLAQLTDVLGEGETVTVVATSTPIHTPGYYTDGQVEKT